MRLRSILTTAFLLPLLATAAAAQSTGETERPWLAALYANHGRFDSGDVGSDGAQTIGYLQLAYRSGETWGVGVTSSYASTSYTPARADGSFDVTGVTDSALVSYYRLRSGRYTLRFGVDIGVPTGKNALSNDELGRFIADDMREDLMLLNSYGTGTNVAPHVALAYRSDSATWGLGIRYLVAGEYDPSNQIVGDTFDPGDALTVVGSSLFDFGRRDTLMVTILYTSYGEDAQGGRKVFKNGDSLIAEGRFVRRWSPELTSSLVGVVRTQGKNERLAQERVSPESGNANGNAYEVFVENAYNLRRGVTATAVVGAKRVDANEYAAGDALHDAGRLKIYLEPGAIVRISEAAYATAKFRYSYLSDKADAYSPADATYGVYHLDVGVVFSF